MSMRLFPVVGSMTPRPAERPGKRDSSAGAGGAWVLSGGPEDLVFLVFTVIYSCALWNSHLGFQGERLGTQSALCLWERTSLSLSLFLYYKVGYHGHTGRSVCELRPEATGIRGDAFLGI